MKYGEKAFPINAERLKGVGEQLYIASFRNKLGLKIGGRSLGESAGCALRDVVI